MLKNFLRNRLLISLLIISFFIKLFSLFPAWVEKYYSFELYPVVSKILRALFGWIPFSIGDILYLAAFLFIVLKAWKFIRLLAKQKLKEHLSWILFKKYLKLFLWMYILFHFFLGIELQPPGNCPSICIQKTTLLSRRFVCARICSSTTVVGLCSTDRFC